MNERGKKIMKRRKRRRKKIMKRMKTRGKRRELPDEKKTIIRSRKTGIERVIGMKKGIKDEEKNVTRKIGIKSVIGMIKK